ncbi:hypothetical protein [Rickettsia endosymbiont of Halotydeus destructor]|uniref:hypothetical protein n=1 Tax=Rickettsia endosymbiont of Halotydeus destructor TaxID=2996754 RepID=UPI003BB04F4F
MNDNTNKNIISTKDTELADQNLLATYRYFGMQTIQMAGVNYHLLKTGCKHPFWNMFILPESIDSKIMDELENIFKSQKLPFAWWVDENKISNYMKERLESRNYSCFGDVPGMVIDLTNHQERLPNDLGSIQIRPVTSSKDFGEWVSVLMECFGFGSDVYNLYINKFLDLLGKDDIFIPFAAYDDKKIVATASIIFIDGIAGFYNGSTLPECRNFGIASSLYHTRFKMLKQLKIPKAFIQTSPMSTSIAQKAGFHIVKNYKLYYGAR